MRLLERIEAWLLDEAPPKTAERTRPGAPVEILEALAEVMDPELGLDVVTLGLIRAAEVVEGEGRVDMTLTTPGCPVGPLLVAEVEERVRAMGLKPAVRLVFDPPWSPDDIAPHASGQPRRPGAH